MELLMTAFVALLIYLFIAMVVSLMSSTTEGTGGGDSRTMEKETKLSAAVVEDVKSLKVGGAKRKKRVRFAPADQDALVSKVDNFQGQAQSSSDENSRELVEEKKSGFPVESAELGFVVEEVGVLKTAEDVGSGIGGLVVEETCVDEVCGAGVGEVVDDEVDCEKSVKLGSDDVDDQSGHVRFLEVGEDPGSGIKRELHRNEDIGGERVEKFDDQSEDIGVVEAREDQQSEMEGIADLEMVTSVDDQSEHHGVVELRKDQGSAITRELNGNENVDREVVVNFDDQSTILKFGEDQGGEIAREIIGVENADEGIGNKLVNDDIVNELNEQVGLMTSQKDNGGEIDTELDKKEKKEKDDGQIGMALPSDAILDDETQRGKIMEIGELGEDQQSGNHSELNEGEESLIYDEDDDWEGIEKSDLEKVFATAANYANDDQLLKLGSDVQMQLYGLHKVAMEGPCHEAQPMALKVSARAKWNAWQKLGNMNPEVAMEQYIDLLQDKVPGWSKNYNSTEDGEVDTTGAAIPGITDPHTTTLTDSSQKEKKVELISCSAGGVLTRRSNSVNEDEE